MYILASLACLLASLFPALVGSGKGKKRKLNWTVYLTCVACGYTGFSEGYEKGMRNGREGREGKGMKMRFFF
jgi:hypothetical protein